jgi:hypothetical protein
MRNACTYLGFEGEVYQMFSFREFKSKLLDDHFFLFVKHTHTHTNSGAFGNARLSYLVLSVCHILFISLVC